MQKLKAFISPPFLTRLALYGGCMLSLGLLALYPQRPQPQDFLQLQQYSFRTDAEGTLQRILLNQVNVYGRSGEFTIATHTRFSQALRDRFNVVVWTADMPSGRSAGPYQSIKGQVFPPSRDQGFVITLESERHYFIGLAYAVEDGTAQAYICKRDRPFHPTDIQQTNEEGTVVAQCPEDAISVPFISQ